MCNSIILKLEDISSIKRYFEFILSQTEKGEKFPIKLDDVFALVYSRKDKAVRALIDSDQFMQDIDYKVFPLNGENSNGGRPSMVYMLSVSCLEYFIARKVRSVFEVYRNELVKATLMYLDDPDAPEGVAFIRWLAVQDYLGEKINWKDLT